jgi:hypothetical protein
MLAWRWRSCFILILGTREGSDPRGESLRKNFVPGLRSVKKKLICWFVDMSTDFKSVNFSRQNKKLKDQQMSRRQISFSGTLYSTRCDNCHFLIGTTSAAGDCHQNCNHRGGRLSSCQKRRLILFTVCLFFCSSESFEKLDLPPEKKTKWRETLGRTP